MTTPDHGASAERTRLAWRRTALSGTVVGLLMLRPAFNPAEGGQKWLIAALSMAGWATVVAIGYRRAHGLAKLPPKPGRRAIVAYALITTAFAVLGVIIVLT